MSSFDNDFYNFYSSSDNHDDCTHCTDWNHNGRIDLMDGFMDYKLSEDCDDSNCTETSSVSTSCSRSDFSTTPVNRSPVRTSNNSRLELGWIKWLVIGWVVEIVIFAIIGVSFMEIPKFNFFILGGFISVAIWMIVDLIKNHILN